MHRRALISGALGLLAAPRAAEAQHASKVTRIGFLSSSSAERERSLLAEFLRALRELGYVEARHFAIERRYAAGRFETLPALATELVRARVDVLVVTGAPAAHAAKNATARIPVVMTNAADPVGTGLVTSLARPGGNITGLSDFNAGVVTKRLEILKEMVPSASRVGVLLNPANPTNPLQLKLAMAAAPTLGVTLLPLEARGADDIDRAFLSVRKERPGGLMLIGDPMFGSHRKKIIDFAAISRLPANYSVREWPQDGGLMSYGTSFDDLYRRAASYVDKILKGARPADLPVEQPTKFELVINRTTANALGLTIPPSLLLRADQVIQ